MDHNFKLASVPFLVLLNGFFVAAEFALVKIRDTQLETLVSTGQRRGRVARRIVRISMQRLARHSSELRWQAWDWALGGQARVRHPPGASDKAF